MKSNNLLNSGILIAALVIGITLGWMSITQDSGSNEVISTKGTGTQSLTKNDSSKLLPQLSLKEIKEKTFLEASRPENERDEALLSLLFNEWIQYSPIEALSFAQENKRVDWLMEGLRLAGKEHADDAFTWINTEISNLNLQRGLEAAVFSGIAQEDPRGALTRLDTYQEGPRKNQLLSTVLSEWTKSEPDSVFNWFEKQEPSTFLFNAYQEVMYNYIGQFPKESSVLVAAMNGHSLQANFAHQAAQLLAKEDPQSALLWAKDLDGDAKKRAMRGIIEEWGVSSDTQGALDYVRGLPEGENNKQLFDVAVQRMAYADHEALKKQMNTFDEDQKKVAISSLAQIYSRYDPDMTATWIETLPEGAVRNSARDLAIRSANNPQAALMLSDTITDSAQRQEKIKEILQVMGQYDPDGAAEVLDGLANVSAEQKEELSVALDKVPKQPGLLPAKKNFVFPNR